MALSPVEIRHMHPPRAVFGGYRRDPTDRMFDEIVASFEDVWRERADLADKVERLEDDLVRYRELEGLLRTTLVSAERASQELIEQARREAELVIAEGHAAARKITHDASYELEHMRTESRRIRSLLGAALATLAEGEEGADEEDAVGGEARAA